MILQVNGETHEFPSSIRTLADVLLHLELGSENIMIMVGSDIYKSNFSAVDVVADSEIEILQFVGGGSGQ